MLQPDDVYGEVSDKQRFSSPEKRMAAFFLDDFLGCEVRDDPTQTTNAYYVSGEKFLNEEEEFVFAGGIRVRGPQQALEEHAEISEGEDNTLDMWISDRLDGVHGASKRRR